MTETRWPTVIGVALSVAAHLAVAVAVAAVEPPPPRPDYAPMRVVERPKPPPPEPEPEPQPEPVKEREPPSPPPPEQAEVIEYERIVDEPPAPAFLEPLAGEPMALTQGLTMSSMSTGSSSLKVRAGSSTAVAASAAPPAPSEHTVGGPASWTEVGKRPRCRVPKLEVPEAVIEARLEGVVEVELTVDASGAVTEALVTRGLSPEADLACITAWRGARCRPGTVDHEAVTVYGMPHSCRFEAIR